MRGSDGLFTGRVALVTGASRGIGKAIAASLLREGATVYVNSRTMEAAQAACRELKAPGRCYPVAADITHRPDVERMVDFIVSESGCIDFLVNNAGITNGTPLLQLTDAKWDAVINTNLRAVFLCTQIVAPHMIRQRFGRIVNASSFAASIPRVGRSVYAATKAGVEALTKAWAAELAPYNIAVNAYAPGFIATSMTKDASRVIRDTIALRRFGTVDEVAAVVTFLLSPHTGYVTGTILDVHGGMLVVQNPADAWRVEGENEGST